MAPPIKRPLGLRRRGRRRPRRPAGPVARPRPRHDAEPELRRQDRRRPGRFQSRPHPAGRQHGARRLDPMAGDVIGDQQDGYQSTSRGAGHARALYSGDTGDDVLAVQRMLVPGRLGARTPERELRPEVRRRHDPLPTRQRYPGDRQHGPAIVHAALALRPMRRPAPTRYTPGPPRPHRHPAGPRAAARCRSLTGLRTTSRSARPSRLSSPFLTTAAARLAFYRSPRPRPNDDGSAVRVHRHPTIQRPIDPVRRAPARRPLSTAHRRSQYVTTFQRRGRVISFGSAPAPKSRVQSYRLRPRRPQYVPDDRRP